MSAGAPRREWQRLAWALGADDIGTDEPTDETDPETHDWRDWAERTHGARARDFIAAFDALARIRGVASTADSVKVAPLGAGEARALSFEDREAARRERIRAENREEWLEAAARRQVEEEDARALERAVRQRDADRCRSCDVVTTWNDPDGPRLRQGRIYPAVRSAAPWRVSDWVVACRRCASDYSYRGVRFSVNWPPRGSASVGEAADDFGDRGVEGLPVRGISFASDVKAGPDDDDARAVDIDRDGPVFATPRGVDARGDGINRDVVGDTADGVGAVVEGAGHSGSPSVGSDGGASGVDPTVGEGVGAGRVGSPPAASAPDPDVCPNCGEPYARHSGMIRGPHQWACFYDGAHATDEDLAELYNDEDGDQ